MKVLLADDKASMRNAMKEILKDLGITDIVEASDGNDAWEKIITGYDSKTGSRFDVVISDMEMPGMTGLELLRAIRDTDHLNDLCFIMATTVSTRQMILETMKLGIQAYILKPFDRQSVMLKLKQAGVL